MSKLKFGSVETPVLFAAPAKGSVELAAFSTPDGQQLVSNADRTPFSPSDGAQLQPLSSKKTVLSARQIANCVSVGKCPACQSHILASASMADAIEASEADIHCPICTAAVSPAIDLNVLTSALRDEFTATAADDDEDFGADDDADGADDVGDDDGAADEGDDYDDSDDSDDEDFGDDDFEDDSDEDFGDDDEGDDADDTTEDEDDEIATAAAQLRKRIKRRKALAAEADDADDMGADDEAEEVDSAEASVRKRLAKKRRKAVAAEDADIDDGEVDDDGVPDGDADADDEVASTRRRMRGKFRKKKVVASDGDADDDGVPDDADADADGDGFSDDENEVIAALASTVRREYAKRGLTTASVERTVAGKVRQTDKVEKVLASARDRLRGRDTVDGNKRLKSQTAVADLEEIEMNEVDTSVNGDKTPGTTSDAVVTDGKTPGTEEAKVKKVKAQAAEGDADAVTDDATDADVVDQPVVDADADADADAADEVVAGDSTVEWRRVKPELVASTASTDKHVFVDGRPVGRLIKERASTGVAAQWDKPTLAVAFSNAAAEGLMPETAADFGFVAHNYVVKGDAVFRQTLRRAADINTRNSQREVASHTDRYKQSVRTAFVAAVKGVYPELKNPVRDSLVADLHKCGVHDARTVVDKAFASVGDALVAGVFAKADELAAKPDAARNEAAEFVAQAAYQSRDVEAAANLAGRLAMGNRSAVPTVPAAPSREVASATGVSTSDRVRAALRSIGR